MADREKTFPDPGAKSGDYAVEWLVGKRQRFIGEVTLAPRQPPQIALHGKLRRPRRNAAGEFVWGLPGNDVRYPRLVGRFPSNEEIVVIDANLSEWFPHRFLGHGHWAIVGLDIASVPDDRYDYASFQISDADLWFGAPPLAKQTWPKPTSATKTYSATLNKAAHRVWRDTRNGITVDFGYPHTFNLDPYRFGLTFAPVFDLRSRQPFTLDEWRDQWIAPLVDLASIATKRPQTLSWLKVHHGKDRSLRSGTVFGGGIHQSPYTAHYDEDWRTRAERRPLFTLVRTPVTPMRLVRRWRALQASDDPFVELYRAALFQPDLPPRACFLHLIQALEARHSFANRESDEKAQTRFKTKRDKVIESARDAGLASQDLRFLKDEWSNQRRESLERRLLPLLNDLPAPVRHRMESDQEMDPVRSQLIAEDNATTLQAQLRVLRNKLSHGERNYPDHNLEPWIGVVETICRAKLLDLLGFDSTEIETALTTHVTQRRTT
jgi:hypothetical protein